MLSVKKGWSILYRGPLASCNYECAYCPFLKSHSTREQRQEDEDCLRRFTAWVGKRSENLRIFFTPWGEAIPHRWYQKALCELSHVQNVRRVAIQTNLSGSLGWIGDADPAKLALWCTFHPTQVSLAGFLAQCRILDGQGIRYSVGVVGVREAFPYLKGLRAGLCSEVYLWINAYKRDPNYYRPEEIGYLTSIDPLFPFSRRHTSLGHVCRTGHTVFSVDGNGCIHRCPLVKTVIGNIYESGFESALQPRPCPAETCDCHIGYVHLEQLGLEAVFGDGLLERIPVSPQLRQLQP